LAGIIWGETKMGATLPRYLYFMTAVWVLSLFTACQEQPEATARPEAMATAVGVGTATTGQAATPAETVGSDPSAPLGIGPAPTATAPLTPTPALPPPTATPTPLAFQESFTGHFAAPTAWRSAGWDITIHSRDRETWQTLEPMEAHHGPGCEPPPVTHSLSRYEQTVYQCHDHLMTAINASGYGLIYLTPDHMVDFANGEAVIRFDLSTFRSSGRDWIDLWLTPYEDNLQLTLDSWLPDLHGEPRRSVHIVMDFLADSIFRAEVVRDFEVEHLPATAVGWRGYETFLEPSAQRRDTFELRISETHIKFGMPDYDFWWIDTAIEPLGWTTAVVQFGHHTYNPRKDCPFEECRPNTWHWDNIWIQPALPFTILAADRRYVDSQSVNRVTFAAPAPADAHLRFSGIGVNLEVSFDNGRTWEPAQLQQQQPAREELFRSYWMPAPAGVRTVMFRGTKWWGGDWHVRDISIWAPAASTTAVP
jgi:PAS domain-containing protein